MIQTRHSANLEKLGETVKGWKIGRKFGQDETKQALNSGCLYVCFDVATLNMNEDYTVVSP